MALEGQGEVAPELKTQNQKLRTAPALPLSGSPAHRSAEPLSAPIENQKSKVPPQTIPVHPSRPAGSLVKNPLIHDCNGFVFDRNGVDLAGNGFLRTHQELSATLGQQTRGRHSFVRRPGGFYFPGR